MEKIELDNIILSLIYSISSYKTENELVEKSIPLFLKKFNCSFGAILKLPDFEIIQ